MKEIILIKSVLTYSIDNDDHENNEILKLLGLNANTFYRSKIYKRRLRKEQEIKNAIASPSGAIKIIGKAGTGKTTVTTKVLREFGEEYIAKKIDVKKLSGIEDPSLNSGAQLEIYLDSILLKHLLGIITDNDIVINDILGYYLESGGKVKEHIRRNSSFTIIESKIKQLYLRKKRRKEVTGSLVKWFFDLEPNTNAYEYNLINELSSALLPENIVYFFRNKLNLIKGCIFFFDNVDSIVDDEVRLTFFNIIDKYQAKKSDCITIMVSFRSNNPSLIERTDFGSFNEIKINMDIINDNENDSEDLVDNESEILNLSKKTFKEKIEEDELDLTGLTQKQIYYSKRKHNSKKNKRFALQLIHRRINYLLHKNINLKNNFDFKRIRDISSLIFTFLKDKHLSLTTATVGNYDRRETLLIISDFIKHFYLNNLDKKILKLKTNRQRMIFYESHYYKWLGSKTTILPKNLKNIYSELKLWRRNQSTHSGCLFDLQLMNFILNNTDPSDESVKDAKKLLVKDIYDVFANIGVDKARIRKGLFRLYKQDKKHLGLIEMSRFYGILSSENIDEDDEIWLTPRGESYIMYINLKYSYLQSLIEIDINYGLISKISLEKMFNTLLDIGNMYLNGLKNLKLKLKFSFPNKEKKFWIEYYSKKFTISTPSYKEISIKNQYKNFHFINLINSHIKYISLIIQQNENELDKKLLEIAHGNYNIMISRFESILDDLVDDKEKSQNVINFRPLLEKGFAKFK